MVAYGGGTGRNLILMVTILIWMRPQANPALTTPKSYDYKQFVSKYPLIR